MSTLNHPKLYLEHLEQTIGHVYESMMELEESGRCTSFCFRHDVESMLILTVYDQESVTNIMERLKPHIEGKTVVEVGSGVGLLAMEIARYAKHVFAIEADPAWSWTFTQELYDQKPPNLTWIFGNAQGVVDMIKADVGVVCTYSAHKPMNALVAQMAPRVIDIYDEWPELQIQSIIPKKP